MKRQRQVEELLSDMGGSRAATMPAKRFEAHMLSQNALLMGQAPTDTSGFARSMMGASNSASPYSPYTVNTCRTPTLSTAPAPAAPPGCPGPTVPLRQVDTPYMEYFGKERSRLQRQLSASSSQQLVRKDGVFCFETKADKKKFTKIRSRAVQLDNNQRYVLWARATGYLNEVQLIDHAAYMDKTISDFGEIYEFEGIAAYDQSLREKIHAGEIDSFSFPVQNLVMRHLLPCIKSRSSKRDMYDFDDDDDSSEEYTSSAKKKKARGTSTSGGISKTRRGGGGKKPNKQKVNRKAAGETFRAKFKNFNTDEGKPICFAHNLGGCKNENCTREHVCHVCFKKDCKDKAHKVTA